MVGEKKWVPYILLLPWALGFLILKVYPFINSFYLSLFSKEGYNVVFVGLRNYKNLFDKNNYFASTEFLPAIKATFQYAFLTVPLVLVFSLLIAVILSKKMKGIGFFRTAYYIPTVLGANIAIVILWRFIFETDGLLNAFLGIFNVEPRTWLSTTGGAMVAIISLRVWQFGSTMLIFLNALNNVPNSLYEAATIDGASRFQRFTKITIPMITPIILFNAVMRLIECFQVFNGPKLITNGEPNNTTLMLNMLIYNITFEGGTGDFYMGSAISWVLFIILMIFTALIFVSSKYWVHYEE